MASANLRYLALRRRLEPLLIGFGSGQVAAEAFAAQVVQELYRALAHWTAVEVYGGDAAALRKQAGHGAAMTSATLRITTLTTDSVVSNGPVRGGSGTATDGEAAELAVRLVPAGQPPSILQVVVADPQAVNYGDRELLAWMAQVVSVAARHTPPADEP